MARLGQQPMITNKETKQFKPRPGGFPKPRVEEQKPSDPKKPESEPSVNDDEQDQLPD